MAEGRGRAEWARTANILAFLACQAGGKPDPHKYNPYVQRDLERLPAQQGDISILKVFIDGKLPEGVL